jgi:ribulose-5-phosphate 4-epimerase/fuculose-1-phosphate aldolase
VSRAKRLFDDSAIMDERDIIDDLVTANHILYNEGVVDGFGHVSVRHPQRPDRFLLSRGIAPGNVQAEDIMEFDLDGHPVEARGRKPYLERFIHSEVYRARADVQSVVHNHSPAVIPFGVTRTRLRPISHMSGFLAGNVPNFEIRDAGGPATDMLIRTPQLGVAFARTLGNAAFALMRGHGAVAVGDSIRQAVYRAIYAEMNARLQSEALRLAGSSDINFLTDAEAAGADAANRVNMDRPWDLWKMRARKNSM